MDVLEAVVERIPAPTGSVDQPLTALIFDAHYDSFRGTIVSCRVFDGSVKHGDIIKFMYNGATYRVEEVGVFHLARSARKALSRRRGRVYHFGSEDGPATHGWGIRSPWNRSPRLLRFPVFKDVKPVVFSSIYPISSDDYLSLAEALEKYKLNDAALIYQKDSSVALGQGFRCGFLGLLHLEIVQERLEREFDQSIIMTFPSVQYKFVLIDGESIVVDNPQYYPDPLRIKSGSEPFIKATIIIPERYMGAVMKLCLERRGSNPRFNYPSPRPYRDRLRYAAGRGHLRFLRQTEDDHAGVWFLRL